MEIAKMQFGYCTNVHAGADLAQTRANLERYALGVKRRFTRNEPLGIGLWLSASAARQLMAAPRLREFAGWLAENQLVPFTLNGFPYGDFHQTRVKHQVYLPTWWEPARAAYTRNLIVLLDALLPPGREGSISTLPIAWGTPRPQPELLAEAAAQLRGIAHDLARLEKHTGRVIHLDLEPEPGCVLQRSEDMVRFFEDYLFLRQDEVPLRRHLRICHDVCHAAVMFEEQRYVMERYRAAGLAVGKVQVSSAVALSLRQLPPAERPAALSQLTANFVEERYLHQTLVQASPGGNPEFFEDLPQALAQQGSQPGTAEWRVHFHVPVYLQRLGYIQALQQPIIDCLRIMKKEGSCQHFEVETYAWGVLPQEFQQPDLSAGIAEELGWFAESWDRL